MFCYAWFLTFFFQIWKRIGVSLLTFAFRAWTTATFGVNITQIRFVNILFVTDVYVFFWFAENLLRL